MDWTESLEIVVARTKHEAYRQLTAEDHPDREARDAYRRLMVFMAGEEETDMERVARLIAEDPPERNTGAGPCGPCH